MREPTRSGSPSLDDAQPTEELYIKLRRLEEEGATTPPPVEALPDENRDDLTGLKPRIAHLKALLSDRGAGDSQ